MSFWIAIVRLIRSPRVIVSAVLVGLSAGAATYVLVPMQYESDATMVLTTTEFGGTESLDPTAPNDLTNPMLNFSDSLRTTADMLIWSMSNVDVAEEFDVDGSADMVVNDGRTNPDLLGFDGPILYVSATSTDPAVAHDLVLRASEKMRTRLQAWQRSMGAPEKTYITAVDVVAPSGATPALWAQAKLGVLAMVGGLLLTLATAYAGRRLGERRAARTSDREARALAQAVTTRSLPADDLAGVADGLRTAPRSTAVRVSSR